MSNTIKLTKSEKYIFSNYIYINKKIANNTYNEWVDKELHTYVLTEIYIRYGSETSNLFKAKFEKYLSLAK